MLIKLFNNKERMRHLKLFKSRLLVEVTSALFILLFVYTGISKLFEVSNFAGTLSKSPLLGNYAGFISFALPLAELVVACLLFFPKTRKLGLWSSLSLMIAFTSYLVYMIYFTPHLPCTCGGVLATMSWKEHLVFNIAFTTLAIFALLVNNKINWQSQTEANPNFA